MKRTKLTHFLLLLLAMSACVTPMTPEEIEEVTTCRDVTLADIRKNMLLNGFVIEDETANDIITEFKQTDGWHGDRRYVRVSAVEIGEKTFKLKVRTKSVRIERGDRVGMGMTSHHPRRRQESTVIFDFSRPIEVESEEDQEYYQEHRSRHEQLQREICGR